MLLPRIISRNAHQEFAKMAYSLTDDEIRLLKELRGPASAVALFLKRR